MKNSTKKIRLGIIDDDVDVVKQLCFSISKKINAQYYVWIGIDDYYGLKYCLENEESPLDCLIIDINIPKFKNGYRLGKYVREKVGNKLPIIYVSTIDNYIDEEIQKENTYFVPKPIKVENCVRIISSYIEDKQDVAFP